MPRFVRPDGVKGSPRLGLALVVLAGCVRSPGGTEPSVPSGNLHAFGVDGAKDPMVRGARVVPESFDEQRSFGVEPGGGTRAIAAGMRVVNLANGAVLVAADRLPQPPQLTVTVPDRLGGGFLFVLGPVVWRADQWLARARPIYTSPFSIAKVILGLDRVYLRGPNGVHQAIDVASGERLDLGPWPGSSFVGQYAAADGWRAVAVNDLRGAVATFDAGATWRPLALPIDARDVVVSGDAILVGGADASRQTKWFEVRADGQVGKLASAPLSSVVVDLPSPSVGARPFGKRPLAAAIEDGWPLADGTAIVARDGALARVRLSDGALVDLATDAFPLKPSRCHPLPMSRTSAPGAFGFVCGEPRGRTIVFAYDATRARLTELRRWGAPRMVTASGNGAIAVRGACAEDAPSDDGAPDASPGAHPPPRSNEQSYCILPRDAPLTPRGWREVRVRGEVGSEKVVVLADGRIAVISPPHGDLATARLTVLDATGARTVPIAFTASPSSDAARALRLGVWLEGFEERRPGVLGGWIEAAGAMMGLEIALDGHAKEGAFVRDAGSPMVSGRYGLGWLASRRGYETIDGGMTWTPLDLPEPLSTARTVPSRACGPIGCTAAGWLRVGWGAQGPLEVPQPPPAARPVYRPTRALSLACEALMPPPPTPPPTPRSPSPIDLVGGLTLTRRPLVPNAPALQDIPPFYGAAPPPRHADELALTVEASESIEHARGGPLARVYAWGPKTGEWAHASHWAVRWLWPFAGSHEVRSTTVAMAPYASLDVARRALGVAQGPSLNWTFGVADDATHALIAGRRSSPSGTTVIELEADRAPTEIQRSDGDPFGEIDAALRVGAHWILATPQSANELPASVLWLVDGASARELARIPRGGFDFARPAGVRLARRADGRAVGLVVDGQPGADRSIALRWVLPVDLETGALGDPEPLGASDLSDRDAVPPCGDGAASDAGWVLDSTWFATARLVLGDRGAGTLTGLFARLHVTRDRACLERLTGNYEAQSGTLDALTRASRSPHAIEGAAVSVSAFASRARYALRCVRADP